ncbi:hypothetical protein GN244_ATG15113 [Phytophthora infestans]|uniref:Fibrous sheath-interacting protein 1 n=1 Tax=Phytophthora infestans TaxID=4787 RepID=A0A833WG36_PHYIN|nr:hypothetical protein GN244_ATG15113 [Phytophthora infestans]
MQRPRSEGRQSSPNSQNRSSLVTRSLQFGARAQRSQSRRPNTTPKPRIQRLLLGPGHQDGRTSSTGQSPSTLTRLPNSPPRLPSIGHFDTLKVESFARNSAETGVLATEPSVSLKGADAEGNRSNLSDDSSSSTNQKEYRNASDPEELEQDQSGDTKTQEPEEIEDKSPSVAGPLLMDIGTNLDASPNESDDDDDEYKQALASRKQLLHNEASRQRTRKELEAYVGSLSSLTDEEGEHLVEFPKNYQQVVSLMTQKDVNEEDTSAHGGKHSRQSWSRVLIESGLSKQQAFGIIEDVDDDPEGTGTLAAKIALKMARIRQLDTILEEKLGKNLYAKIVPMKQNKAKSAVQHREIADSSASRTFVTQTTESEPSVVSNGAETSRSSSSNRHNDEAVTGARKGNNFIERNKQVVANGMKANMTKEEEERVDKLLQDEMLDSPASEENARPEVTTPQPCNEFTMTYGEKKAIEELIATKSRAYPLTGIDELQEEPTDEALRSAGGSSRPVRDNLIQESKRERLQRQRLSRVEQELRFLQECPSVVIVGDERDEDEHDECRSEVSFATVASSTCSTRSGVISRHDFKCFLAQQKEKFRSSPIASADEIRQLLQSIKQRNFVIFRICGCTIRLKG